MMDIELRSRELDIEEMRAKAAIKQGEQKK